jgi:hypothetical protein
MISREDAIAIVEVLVATGRAVPAHRWVDGLVERERAEKVARMPHNLC